MFNQFLAYSWANRWDMFDWNFETVLWNEWNFVEVSLCNPIRRSSTEYMNIMKRKLLPGVDLRKPPINTVYSTILLSSSQGQWWQHHFLIFCSLYLSFKLIIVSYFVIYIIKASSKIHLIGESVNTLNQTFVVIVTRMKEKTDKVLPQMLNEKLLVYFKWSCKEKVKKKYKSRKREDCFCCQVDCNSLVNSHSCCALHQLQEK